MLTALIVMASEKGDVLPSILPLVPISAIIALLAVGSKGDPLSVRRAYLVITKNLPANAVFLGASYLFIGQVDYRFVISGGLGAWVVVAALIFLASRGESSGRSMQPGEHLGGRHCPSGVWD